MMAIPAQKPVIIPPVSQGVIPPDRQAEIDAKRIAEFPKSGPSHLKMAARDNMSPVVRQAAMEELDKRGISFPQSWRARGTGGDSGPKSDSPAGVMPEYETSEPRLLHGGMTARQVYKGRDLEVRKGKDRQSGTLLSYVNGQLIGTPIGSRPDQVSRELESLRKYVDAADVPGSDYGDSFQPKDKYRVKSPKT